jgi:hypothetical protein
MVFEEGFIAAGCCAKAAPAPANRKMAAARIVFLMALAFRALCRGTIAAGFCFDLIIE